MLPHQYRVVREKAQLDERLARLRYFISSPTFQGVNEPERLRLIEQADIMDKLSNVLARRIDSFMDTTLRASTDAELATIQLSEIGVIRWTELDGVADAPTTLNNTVQFWGRFDCQGDALIELLEDKDLHKHLIAASLTPRDGWVKCVASRA